MCESWLFNNKIPPFTSTHLHITRREFCKSSPRRHSLMETRPLLYLDYQIYSKSVHTVFGPIRGITAHNWPFRAPVTLEIICVQCQHLGDNCLGNPPSQGPSSILLSQNLANMPQSVYFFCIDIPLQHVDNIWRHIGCCWLDCSSVELMQLILQLRTDLRWILEMTQK